MKNNTKHHLIALFTLMLIVGGGELAKADGEASDTRPNFLFILTDDQAQQTLGCYGNTICQTPNIDSIAARGMLIRDAHHMGAWTGAVCTASRTMIMTGKSVWKLPNYWPVKKNDPESKQERWKHEAAQAKNSLPAIFNAAHYDTFRTCKKGNSYEAANRLFTERHDAVMRDGNKSKGSYWHGQQVIDFLQKRTTKKDANPFFIFLGFSHPHDPREGTPELLKKYGAVNVNDPPDSVSEKAPPLPISYLPQHPFHHGHPGLRDEVNVPGVLKDRSPATVRNELGREYACIENIDNQIGRVLNQLKSMGELENTYVIFTSDHGIAVGRHGLMGKQNLYEHTWRVPFLVSGPGIQPGSQSSGFIYLMDLLPTLCELAAVEPPEGMDGQSFASVLKGQRQRIRDVVYGVYSGGSKPGIRSIKTSEGWKLIKYDVLDGYVRESQLFELNTNPHELIGPHHDPAVQKLTGNRPEKQHVNLWQDPAAQTQKRELEKLLAEQMKKNGDPYVLWDQP